MGTRSPNRFKPGEIELYDCKQLTAEKSQVKAGSLKPASKQGRGVKWRCGQHPSGEWWRYGGRLPSLPPVLHNPAVAIQVPVPQSTRSTNIPFNFGIYTSRAWGFYSTIHPRQVLFLIYLIMCIPFLQMINLEPRAVRHSKHCIIVPQYHCLSIPWKFHSSGNRSIGSFQLLEAAFQLPLQYLEDLRYPLGLPDIAPHLGWVWTAGVIPPLRILTDLSLYMRSVHWTAKPTLECVLYGYKSD